LPFSKWCEFAHKKFGGSHVKKDFEIMNAYFEKPNYYYEISDPSILFQSHEEYQRPGFTDKKWKLLNLSDKELNCKTVMDLGCNAGWIGDECLNHKALGVDGVDYNWRYLEEARMKGYGKTYLEDLDDFNFEKQYDIVLCLAVFHYVRDKEKLLEKIASATKEMFILEIPVNSLEIEALVLHDTGKCKYFIPSFPLIDYWLRKYFNNYELSESIAPDNSKRFIFKCYK
jgi:2-polyprenyl-3-methyl-5-hydroxy-6-metoxy-1,4-benzoquinol methylase